MKDAPVATTRYPMAAKSIKDIGQEVWVVQSDSSGGEDECELRECSGSSGEELDLHVALAGREVADGSGEWWTELLVQLSPQNLGPSMLHYDVLRFCQVVIDA